MNLQTEWLRGRLYERRDSLQRVLRRKKRSGEATKFIEELIEANAADIDLIDNGPKMSRQAEEAIDAAFIGANGL